ncbi:MULTISPECIES: hypothetical protein [Eikenella]
MARSLFSINLYLEVNMPQTLIQVSGMKHKTDEDRLVLKGETVAGVRMVNANHDNGRVVITHGEGFDLETFKAAISAEGFTVA